MHDASPCILLVAAVSSQPGIQHVWQQFEYTSPAGCGQCDQPIWGPHVQAVRCNRCGMDVHDTSRNDIGKPRAMPTCIAPQTFGSSQSSTEAVHFVAEADQLLCIQDILNADPADVKAAVKTSIRNQTAQVATFLISPRPLERVHRNRLSFRSLCRLSLFSSIATSCANGLHLYFRHHPQVSVPPHLQCFNGVSTIFVAPNFWQRFRTRIWRSIKITIVKSAKSCWEIMDGNAISANVVHSI